MKKFIFIFTLASLLIGSSDCFSQTKEVLTKEQKEQSKRIYFLNDTLLTKSEQILKAKYFDLLINSLYIDGKKICTNLKEADFIKNNIPAFYYNDLTNMLADINSNLAKDTLTNINKLNESLLELKKQYSAFKEKKSKK